MAGNEALISVVANISKAERSIDQLVKKLGAIQNTVINIDGSAAVKKTGETVNAVKNRLSELGKEARTATGQVTRLVEGVGTLAVAGKGLGGAAAGLGAIAAKATAAASAVGAASDSIKRGFGLGGLKDLLNSAAGQFDHFAASAQSAAAKMQAVHGPMQAVVDLLSGLGPELTAVAGVIAMVGAAAHDKLGRDMVTASEEASLALAGITDQVQALLQSMAALNQSGGSLAIFKELEKAGRNRLENNTPGTPEFRKGANTVAVAQRNIQEINREITDAIRLANGLRSVSEEIRALNTYNVTQNKKSFLKQQAEDAKELKAALQGMEFGSSNPFGIGPDQEQEALLTRYTSDMEKLQQVLGQMESKSSNPFGITAEQIEIADHNTKKWQADLEQVNAELQDMMQVHRALGRMEGQRANPFGIEIQQIEEAYNFRMKEEKAFDNLRLDTIQRQLMAELDAIDEVFDARTKANAAALKDFDNRLRGRTNAKSEQGAQGQRGSKLADSLMMGVGFPLLFGAGPGSVLGSLAGSFGGNGFGGQIFGGAIGQLMDQFAAAAMEAGSALRRPIENFSKLKDSGILASRSQEELIDRLIELGEVSRAVAIIQEEVIKKIGVQGWNDLQRLGEATDELSRAWAELNLQLQAFIAGPLAEFLKILASTLGTKSAATRVDNLRGDLSAADRNALDAELRKAFADRAPRGFARDKAPLSKSELELLGGGTLDSIASKFEGRVTKGATSVKLSAKELQDAADKQLATAEKRLQLQRQGVALEQQATDLRRSIEQRIFDKRMEISRMEVQNAERQAMLGVGRQQLDYQRLGGQKEGFEQQVLQAEANLQRVKGEGQARLQAAEKNFKLDLLQLERDNQNWIFSVERQIYQLRIAAADYETAKEKERIRLVQNPAAAAKFTGNLAGGFYTQGGIGPRGANQYGGHFDIARQDGGYFKRSALDNYVTVNGRPLSSGATVAGGQYGASRDGGSRTHRAWDYAFGGGAQLSLRNGAQWKGSSRGSYGDNAVFMTPDGQVYRIIHGTFSPGVAGPGAGAAAALPSAPGLPSTADLDKQQAEPKRQSVELSRQELAIQVEGATVQLEQVARGQLDLQRRKDELVVLTATLGAVGGISENQQQLNIFQAESEARLQNIKDENQRVLDNTKLQGEELTKLKEALGKRIEITKEQISLDEKLLKVQQDQRYALEKARKERELAVAGKGIGAGFIGNAAGAYENELATSGDKQKATELARLTQATDMATMSAQALEGAYRGVGGAITGAMSDGVLALMEGSKTAQDVFADMLRGIGNALISAAQQMIATYIAIGIARLFAGIGGAAGAGGGTFGKGLGIDGTLAGGGIFSGAGPYKFAEGGYVTGPTNALIGEGGESEYVIPASKMGAAMSRYQAGKRGSSVIDGGPGSTSDSTSSAAINVSYTVERINERNYVTEEQFRAGMNQAAKRGAEGGYARTMGGLRNSRSARARVGI